VRTGMIETADTPEEAAGLQVWWADQVVAAGLAPDYGVSVRFVRLSKRTACWGIFIEPQDQNPGGGPHERPPAESGAGAPSRPASPMMTAR